MTGFLGKLFGVKKKDESDGTLSVVENTLGGIIERAGFDLEYTVDWKAADNEVCVELKGGDQELLKAKEGMLLDAFQTFLKRVLIHEFPDRTLNLSVDTGGFREESNQSLIDLAEKLKGIAMEKGKPVYFRALPPRERKVIHQYLANDARVKSRSIGEGLFKKIKIYPIKESSAPEPVNVE